MIKYLGLPPLTSEHGSTVDYFILYVHWLMGALFVGWLAYFIYTLYRFNAKRNKKANYVGVKSHASSYIEGAVVLVEGVLLIGLAIPLWAKLVDQFPAEEESTVVRVIAEQFAWNFRYPGPDGVFGRQDATLITSDNPLGMDPEDPAGKDDVDPGQLNLMVVPVGKPVITHITSKDVVHSFKVSPMRITQDAIPGLSLPTWFTPTKEGTYLINCAQLCGNAHAYMKGTLRVVSQAEYEDWLLEKAEAAAAAEAAEAAAAGGFE